MALICDRLSVVGCWRILCRNLIVRVPVKFSHVSGRKKIETSHPTEFQTNSPILRAIARGMAWLRMLDEGKVSSIHDLADTLKLERKYVRYTLRLAFLSPRVIRAIMQGQEPDGLSLAALRTTLAATSQWAFAQSICFSKQPTKDSI